MRVDPRQQGVSLVELVIAIVIITIAVVGVLAVLSSSSTGSAQTMVRAQAVAIGNAYLEEALLKPFADPDGADTETARTLFDDVDDYNGLDDTGARDQMNDALVGLGAYRITMTVGSGSLGSLAAADVKRVDVTVQHPLSIAMTFSGYRTNYP